MKHLVIAILFFSFTGLHAQKRLPYANIHLQTDQDYVNAEKAALQAANDILSAPIDKRTSNKSDAMHFLIDWMRGTPEYLFPLNEPIVKISSDNPELLIVYMACMTRYVLENDSRNTSKEDDISYNGFLIFTDYCKNSRNHVSIRGELRNLMEAKKDGNLKDYLKEFTEQPKGKQV